MLNILKSLDRSRIVPQVLFLLDGPFVKEVQETGTETHVISAGRIREIVKAWKAVHRTVELIRNQGIDLVHSHNAKAHIYGGLAAMFAGIPSLYHLHGVPKPALSRDGLVSLSSVLVPARQTIACSNHVARDFKTTWRTRRSVVVVHNGVMPANAGSSAGPSVRSEYGIPDKVPLIVLACRLQRWKGAHVFLESAFNVVQEFPEAWFMVVGGTLFGLEESYGQELRRQTERLGLSRHVVFTGYRSDISRFFAAADIVVHSSIEPDPFPTVLLEAMAWGKPVVASDSGGPREIVQHDVTGLLVPPNRPDLQSQALLKILCNPDLGLQMGQAGAARFRAEFQATRMTRQLEALYQNVAEEKHD